MNIDFYILARYVQLMSFDLPLEAVEELCDVSHPTALLWCRTGGFLTSDGWTSYSGVFALTLARFIMS